MHVLYVLYACVWLVCVIYFDFLRPSDDFFGLCILDSIFSHFCFKFSLVMLSQ